MSSKQRKNTKTRFGVKDSERRGKASPTREEEKEEEEKEEEEKDADKSRHGSKTKDNNEADESFDAQDDLSMFDDDDDDDEGELYGQKRNRPDFSTGAPPGSFEMYALNRQELEDRRVRHHQIIRKILAEFDIEEVKEKYRGKGIIRDFSHANRKFRMWLEKVMGNDNVQLSDGKWQELFRQKVREDYEHKLKERERQLAEAEVQRIQRLRLQGILTSDDPRATTKGYGNNSRSKDDIETQMEMVNKNGTSSNGNRTPGGVDSEDEDGKEGRKNDALEGNDKTNGAEEDDGDNIDNKENDASYSNNGHLGMSGSIRPDKNPDIQYLYKEEDLHQLYARAEELIRLTNSTSRK